VQFHWQQEDNMTDWVRVLSPDGGGTDAVGVNRIFVFVLEVGEQVFVMQTVKKFKTTKDFLDKIKI
jgi:hypothetical protein